MAKNLSIQERQEHFRPGAKLGDEICGFSACFFIDIYDALFPS